MVTKVLNLTDKTFWVLLVWVVISVLFAGVLVRRQKLKE